MEINKKKKAVALLSILSNFTLSFLKILTGMISGSLSIISEAIHSLSDLLASFITFFSVSKSSLPADNDHPYGHGKYEDLSGFIEGLLIIFASIFIIYKACKKIILGLPYEVENTLGITVMFLAVITNLFISTFLFKVAKESNSISLYADGEHLRTDVYSSLGVFIGLILIKITKYSILDPIIAILVAVMIYKTGYDISKKSVNNLLDSSLPYEDTEKIKNIINSFSDFAKLKDNSLKTRQIGPSTDIDLILQFPENISICKCHQICNEIEAQIQLIYKNCSISIHSEPICYKKNCQKSCNK